jgi:ankyrin repeat protein
VDVDWETVVQEVQQTPTVARYSDEDHSNMFLLHFVCALKPPPHALEAVLEANPQAIWNRNGDSGITPLMIACGRNASPQVVCRLLKDSKESITVTDTTGYSAIHWACREDVSLEVVRELLIVDPRVANHRIEGQQSFVNGLTPTDILLQNKTILRYSFHQRQKLSLILSARYYGTISTILSTKNGSALHAALALKCSEDVLQFALEQYESAGVRDCHGNLPLHYAVRMIIPSILPKLLNKFPDGASCKDSSGRLPLHAALMNGCTWSQGVRDLFVHNPTAVSVKDEEYNLYPLALSAAFSDLETTFCLLRENPHILARDFC